LTRTKASFSAAALLAVAVRLARAIFPSLDVRR
jgi:hypothetical protein